MFLQKILFVSLDIQIDHSFFFVLLFENLPSVHESKNDVESDMINSAFFDETGISKECKESLHTF